MKKSAYGVPSTPPDPGGVAVPTPEPKPQTYRSTEAPRTLSRFLPGGNSASIGMLRDVFDRAPLPPPTPRDVTPPTTPKLPPVDVQVAREYEKLLNDPAAAASGHRSAFESSLGPSGVTAALQVLSNEGSVRAGDVARRSGRFTPYSREVEISPLGHKTTVGPGFDTALTYLAEGLSSPPRTAMRLVEALRPGTVNALPSSTPFNVEAADPLGGNGGIRAAIARPYDPTIDQRPTPFKVTSNDVNDIPAFGMDAADTILSALPGAGRAVGAGKNLLNRLPSVVGSQTGRVLVDAGVTGATQAGVDEASRRGYLQGDASKAVASAAGMMLGNTAGNKALGSLGSAPVQAYGAHTVPTPANLAAASIAQAAAVSPTVSAITKNLILPTTLGGLAVAGSNMNNPMNNAAVPAAPAAPTPAAPAAPRETIPAPVPPAAVASGTPPALTPPSPVATEPVGPLRQYWDSLGNDSKWLVRGGAGAAGLAAVLAAMRNQNEDEDEEEGGIGSYLAPLLGLGGLGAAAYGAGGGGLTSLPSLSGMGGKYNQLGSAIKQQFVPTVGK